MEDYKKKYEEALERAEGLYNCHAPFEQRVWIEDIFPELKENEDEKIRKELIRAFTVTADKKSHEIYGNGITYGQVLAWLEKQTIDISSFPEEHWVEEYWKHHKVTNPDSYNGGEEIQFDHDGFVRFCQTHCQKSAWSEEDEKIWTTISDLLWEGYKLSDKKVSWNKIRYWLLPKIICLKDRVQPQSKQEWSEEEKARIDKIIDVLDWAEEKGHIHYSDWKDYVCYVKSLKPQNTWKPSDEQMEALYTYIYNPQYFNSPDPRMELVESVYKDLKKLKKE